MSDETITEFENQFLSRARYPKGRKTLQAILDATYDLIIEEGPSAASQQSIADRAKVTQSAVRHYFPTKDDLLLAFFSTGIERIQNEFRAKMTQSSSDPRADLFGVIRLQYASIKKVDCVYFFEAIIFSQRNLEFQNTRDSWYNLLMKYYCMMIQKIHPKWTPERCESTAYQILTLVLGGWITLSNGRSVLKDQNNEHLTEVLIDAVRKFID